MAYNGGDLVEMTYNNPEVGNGVIYFKANEDSTVDIGGYRVEDDPDSIAGNGDMIFKKRLKGWTLEGTASNDMNDKDEVSSIARLSASNVETDFTYTFSNGVVLGGKGKPVGDIQHNPNNATFTIKFSGGVDEEGFGLKKIVG